MISYHPFHSILTPAYPFSLNQIVRAVSLSLSLPLSLSFSFSSLPSSLFNDFLVLPCLLLSLSFPFSPSLSLSVISPTRHIEANVLFPLLFPTLSKPLKHRGSSLFQARLWNQCPFPKDLPLQGFPPPQLTDLRGLAIVKTDCPILQGINPISLSSAPSTYVVQIQDQSQNTELDFQLSRRPLNPSSHTHTSIFPPHQPLLEVLTLSRVRKRVPSRAYTFQPALSPNGFPRKPKNRHIHHVFEEGRHLHR